MFEKIRRYGFPHAPGEFPPAATGPLFLRRLTVLRSASDPGRGSAPVKRGGV